MTAAPMPARPLSGCRILIVEDDYYQAHDSCKSLEQAGAIIVSMSAAVPDLGPLLQQGRIDAALIDINLGQGLSFEFAHALQSQAIPFAFLTGYDASMLPDDMEHIPCISKPTDGARIVRALVTIISGRN